MQSLFVQLHSLSSGADDQQLRWYAPQTEGDDVYYSGTWREFVDWHQQSAQIFSVIAGLPGTDVLSAEVTVPTSNKRHLQRALPFLVEEELASNIEDIHIAAGDVKGNKLLVAIVDIQLMNYWTQLFDEAGIQLTALFAIPDLFDVDKNELLLVEQWETVIIKSHLICTQCEAANLAVYYESLNRPDIDLIRFITLSEQSPLHEFAKKEKLKHAVENEIEAIQETYSGDLFDLLTTTYFSKNYPRINLLQGEFLVASEQVDWQKMWKPLALTAGICAVMQLGLYLSSGFYFNDLSRRINNQSVEVYSEQFPGETVELADLNSALERKMHQLMIKPTRSDFSKLFSVTITAMVKLNNAHAGQNLVEIQELRYQSKSGELKLEVVSSALSQLDLLAQEFEKSGLDAEIVSANESKQQINATLVVKFFG